MMGKPPFRGPLERINDCCWRIPRSYKPGMLVEGRIYSDERLLREIPTPEIAKFEK